MCDFPDWLYEHLMKMEKAQMLEVMVEALDHMQSWNGRSITYCVAMACPDIDIVETETAIQCRIKS